MTVVFAHFPRDLPAVFAANAWKSPNRAPDCRVQLVARQLPLATCLDISVSTMRVARRLVCPVQPPDGAFPPDESRNPATQNRIDLTMAPAGSTQTPRAAPPADAPPRSSASSFHITTPVTDPATSP